MAAKRAGFTDHCLSASRTGRLEEAKGVCGSPTPSGDRGQERGNRCLAAPVAKPAQEGSKNQVELIRLQLSQLSNGPDVWIGRDVLHQERAGPEERDLNRNL